MSSYILCYDENGFLCEDKQSFVIEYLPPSEAHFNQTYNCINVHLYSYTLHTYSPAHYTPTHCTPTHQPSTLTHYTHTHLLIKKKISSVCFSYNFVP